MSKDNENNEKHEENDEEWNGSDSDEELESLIRDSANEDNQNQQPRNNKTLKNAAISEAYKNLDRLERIKTTLNSIAITLTIFALCFLVFFYIQQNRNKPLGQDFSYHGLLNFKNNVNNNKNKIKNDVLTSSSSTSFGSGIDDGAIKRIVVLGERNSGLEQLAFRLGRCYPDIEVITHFTRMGYWFQDTEDKDKYNEPFTIVVAVFLNVYDWVDLMRQNPLYAPNHENMEWKDFLESPWTIVPWVSDLLYADEKGRNCQQNFAYSQVKPCHQYSYKDKYPLYEMKPGSKSIPFNNILELRTEKILNFISTMYMEQVQSFLSVKYEDLLFSGVSDLLGRIEMASGLIGSCPDEEYLKFKLPEFKATTDNEYYSYILEHLDWSTELLVGYKADKTNGRADNYISDDELNLFLPDSTINYLVDDVITDLDTPPTTKNNNPPITHLDNNAGAGTQVYDFYDNKFGNKDDYFSTDDLIPVLDETNSIRKNDKQVKEDVVTTASDMDKILSNLNPNNYNDVFESDDFSDDFQFQQNKNEVEQIFDEVGLNDLSNKMDLMNDYFTDFDDVEIFINDDNFDNINADAEKEQFTDWQNYIDLDNINDDAEKEQQTQVNKNKQGKESYVFDDDITTFKEDQKEPNAALSDLYNVKKDESLINDVNADYSINDDVEKEQFTDWQNINLDNINADVDNTVVTNNNDVKEKFTDWEDKVNSIKEQHKPKVERIVILAERNSGLSWFYRKIVDCYPQLKVSTSLVRPGFLFQTPEQSLDVTTVILSLFVHPYTWVEQMRKNPEFAPHHRDLPWPDFVSSPWNVVNMENDDISSIDTECQYNFKKNYIIPCKPKSTSKAVDKPVYELDINGSGHAYSSIIDLRADKIQNFLRTASWVNVTAFLSINYETLMRPSEFGKLLQAIDADSGGNLNSQCDISTISDYIAPSVTEHSLDSNYDYVKWMDDNLDWDVENMIGYHLDAY